MLKISEEKEANMGLFPFWPVSRLRFVRYGCSWE